MHWDVIEVSVLDDRTLRVTFRDGVSGTAHFEPSFFHGVFEPLQDPAKFREVQAPDGFVTWPGELDLAPDAMHDAIEASDDRRVVLR